ncbi:MAG: TIM-barrel domain-containing protein [Eubacteriales bacterium]
MIDKLHRSGFKGHAVVLPVRQPRHGCFPRTGKTRRARKKSDGTTAISHWWNGYSAVLDLTNPTATAWFEKQAPL